MIINDPDTLAAVTAAFADYERALMRNDLKALDDLFWVSDRTLRYGVGENLYGFDAIREFRIAPARRFTAANIAQYGHHHLRNGLRHCQYGVPARELRPDRPTEPNLGPHAGGVAVVAAHVSMMAGHS